MIMIMIIMMIVLFDENNEYDVKHFKNNNNKK